MGADVPEPLICGHDPRHLKGSTCRKCYQRARYLKDHPGAKTIVRGASPGMCTECQRGPRPLKKGLCGACYNRALRKLNRPGTPTCRCGQPGGRRTGLCKKCYEQDRRAKRYTPKEELDPKLRCGHPDCKKRKSSKGLCNAHYLQQRRAARAAEPKVVNSIIRPIDSEVQVVHWPRWGENGTWTCPHCAETFTRQKEGVAA